MNLSIVLVTQNKCGALVFWGISTVTNESPRQMVKCTSINTFEQLSSPSLGREKRNKCSRVR
ncbi:hypothetical protein LINPERPRIM_LOCUS9432 [Linum perenne]